MVVGNDFLWLRFTRVEPPVCIPLVVLWILKLSASFWFFEFLYLLLSRLFTIRNQLAGLSSMPDSGLC